VTRAARACQVSRPTLCYALSLLGDLSSRIVNRLSPFGVAQRRSVVRLPLNWGIGEAGDPQY